ncbi:MAG: hypothetical protein ONA69_00350 [candidate division KSB1 bacterium]|nr:hypothetical protein [candidate division KSB1 bacterium]MDZ7345222.1 hypothetical protein [candidate division KSB1 bacterium]
MSLSRYAFGCPVDHYLFKQKDWAKAILLLTIFFSSSLFGAATVDIAAVERAIREQGAAWSASSNELTELSGEERRRRLGLTDSPLKGTAPALLSLPQLGPLPSRFDWRDAGGNWVTPVRDQGACGSCWAFSAVAQVESWWNIRRQTADSTLDLSEQILLSCSGAGDCENGGRVDLALHFIRDVGVPPEKSLPYAAKSTVPCAAAEALWHLQTVTIPDWGYVTYGEAQIENIKTALLYHPVSAAFEVFADFYAYKRGIYEHVYGASEGWHAVLIVGWNDDERCWIAKNSWGKNWGESGYFRIRWGQVHFGEAVWCIWDEVSSGQLTASTMELESSIEYGRTDTLSFILRNIGSAPMQYYCMESSLSADSLADWLTIVNGAGTLSAGSSAAVRVVFNARAVPAGSYERLIFISGNSGSSLQVHCRLNVLPPEWDVRLVKTETPPSGFPLLSSVPFGVVVENIGLNAVDRISLVCQIAAENAFLYSDTLNLSLPALSGELAFRFKPFRPVKVTPMQLLVFLSGLEKDLNRFNDTLSCDVQATHLLDDFEAETGFWDFRGGWAVTSKLNGHKGSGAAHINGGVYPYPENMNAVLTFSPGFVLQDVDTLIVTYWARVFTEDGDYCVVEISSDSLHWRSVDILSGMQPPWRRRMIDFVDLLTCGAQKAWFRFRFVSDAFSGSIGVLLDDFNVFTSSVEPEQEPAAVRSYSITHSASLLAAPNPFNTSVSLVAFLAKPAVAQLNISDARGRLVYQSAVTRCSNNRQVWVWDAEGMPTGIYFAQIALSFAEGRREVLRQKLLLIK